MEYSKAFAILSVIIMICTPLCVVCTSADVQADAYESPEPIVIDSTTTSDSFAKDIVGSTGKTQKGILEANGGSAEFTAAEGEANAKLVLDGITLIAKNNVALDIREDYSMVIDLVITGDNHISSNDGTGADVYCIHADTINISGGGTLEIVSGASGSESSFGIDAQYIRICDGTKLTVTANDAPKGFCYGIRAFDDLAIDGFGTEVASSAGKGLFSTGVRSETTLTITNTAKVTAHGEEDGIFACGEVVVSTCSVVVATGSSGMTVGGKLTLDSVHLNVVGNKYYGLHANRCVITNSDVTIKGGEDRYGFRFGSGTASIDNSAMNVSGGKGAFSIPITDEMIDNCKGADGTEIHYVPTSAKSFVASPMEESFAVIYYLNGGTGDVPVAFRVKSGESFQIAAAPQREGAGFAYWEDQFSVGHNPGEKYESVTSNILLTARWKMTVDFATDRGTAPESITVIDDSKIAEPDAPVAEGYVLKGWYLDGELWDFRTDVVTESITLRADWVKVESGSVVIDTDDNGCCEVTVTDAVDSLTIRNSGMSMRISGDAVKDLQGKHLYVTLLPLNSPDLYEVLTTVSDELFSGNMEVTLPYNQYRENPQAYRIDGDVGVRLDCTVDTEAKTVSFSTDRSGVYAICYSEEPIPGASTLDVAQIVSAFVIAVLMIAYVGLITRRE